MFAVAFVVAVACDIHAERHLAKAGGSKRKLRGIPTLEAKQGGAERAKVCTSGARKIGETACGRVGASPLGLLLLLFFGKTALQGTRLKRALFYGAAYRGSNLTGANDTLTTPSY